jgi:hypothetical protein
VAAAASVAGNDVPYSAGAAAAAGGGPVGAVGKPGTGRLAENESWRWARPAHTRAELPSRRAAGSDLLFYVNPIGAKPLYCHTRVLHQ